MIGRILIALLVTASIGTAEASTLGDFRLRPSTALLGAKRASPFDDRPYLPPAGPGGGGDAGQVTGLSGTGFVLVGSFVNTVTLLGTVSFAAQTASVWSGTAVLLSGVALWAAVAKADAWLFDIDRTWGSAFAGAGLGLATGAVVAVVLGAVVPDGPGFDKLAAGLTGFVFGGAIAAPLWTLADPFGLTPAADELSLRRDPPSGGRAVTVARVGF